MMKSKGAVIVEALVGMLLFLGLIGAIITASIAAYRYILLVHTLTTVTREIAEYPNANCAELKTSSDETKGIEPRLKKYMRDTLQVSQASFDDGTITFNNPDDAADPVPAPDVQREEFPSTGSDSFDKCTATIVASGRWYVPCFFCLLFHMKPYVQAQTRITIEDPDFLYCQGVGKCDSC